MAKLPVGMTFKGGEHNFWWGELTDHMAMDSVTGEPAYNRQYDYPRFGCSLYEVASGGFRLAVSGAYTEPVLHLDFATPDEAKQAGDEWARGRFYVDKTGAKPLTPWGKLVQYAWHGLIGSGLFVDDFAKNHPDEASEMIQSHVAGALETASLFEAGLPDEPIILLAMFIASMDNRQNRRVSANIQPSEDHTPFTILYGVVYGELSEILHARMQSAIEHPETLEEYGF